ncbi:MAG: M3 family oligoendopeptidase [Alphaproteobacteria bacterium]|nr:M3 family oligoendopeptidase [Alphaproteobacteria bacterium]
MRRSPDLGSSVPAPPAARASVSLPEWNLADLYGGTDSATLKSDLATADSRAAAFEQEYKGKLATLSGAELGKAIGAYEAISETLSRLSSFAQLLHAGNMSDAEIGRFYQTMQERVTDISTRTLFFALEVNRIDDAVLERQLADPAAKRYAPWLRDVRAFRPHQLSDELEKLLHEKSVAGRNAWVRLFDETMASLRFEVDGRKLTSTETLHLLSHKNRDTRRAAGKSFAQGLGDNARTFALVTNTLIKDKEIEDRWRGYKRPVSSRNLGNFVEDEVVDALVAAIKSSYGGLSHRYYAIKAKWLGLDKLEYWDRNAPLPEDDDREIGWEEARDMVLGAYGAFSPDLAAVGKKFFDNAWIDAPARAGKAGGAFAHPTVPSAHPYLLLNYQGKARDVMTLAHELGHGCHQILAGAQGHLMADTPLTLAETASVFGEMLTFRALLNKEKDPKRRRVLLATKVEDMLNTVVRQIAFFDFETRIHDERRKGELTAERIGQIWMDVQGESLGPALHFDAEYQYYWAYIPHFVHSPFYVYAYAFGDCLVNSLYAVYQDAHPRFVEKYLAMLKAGGTLRHKELLAPFGLDATDPTFWQRGLGVIRGFIDEIEAAT